jgi:regulator of sigma E protease
MTTLITVIAFVLLLTVLIIIHELGHFTLAKLFKVEVEEFGFGLPPRALTLFRAGGTIFSLNWVPFGGFVRLKGDNEVIVEKRFEKGSFAGAGSFARICILCGGVLMNFLLAFALFTAGFSVGRWVPYHYTKVQLEDAITRGELAVDKGVFVQSLIKGGPAEAANVPKGAAILSVDNQPVTTPEDVIRLQEGKTTVRYVLRVTAGKTVEMDVTLADGKAGIALADSSIRSNTRPFFRSVAVAWNEMMFMTVQTIKGIFDLFHSLLTRFNIPEGITGIVGIYGLTSSAVQEGFMTYLQLVALLSLSLAILNVLPLPALDGGRLLFVLAEIVIRRPLNQRFELLTNMIGFFLLIALIVIITFNDVIHLF